MTFGSYETPDQKFLNGYKITIAKGVKLPGLGEIRPKFRGIDLGKMSYSKPFINKNQGVVLVNWGPNVQWEQHPNRYLYMQRLN